MNNSNQPRHQISKTLQQIYTSGLSTTSGGNISIKGSHGNIWITPSSIDKGSISEKDIVRIGPDGICEGLHKPSSELPFHIAVYEAWPDIRAIVHAHLPALVSFSIVGEIPNT